MLIKYFIFIFLTYCTDYVMGTEIDHNKDQPELITWNPQEDVEIVIARYNEDISWVKEAFPNNAVTVYNKGEHIEPITENMLIIELSNIGREAHTYLEHILRNYN